MPLYRSRHVARHGDLAIWDACVRRLWYIERCILHVTDIPKSTTTILENDKRHRSHVMILCWAGEYRESTTGQALQATYCVTVL